MRLLALLAGLVIGLYGCATSGQLSSTAELPPPARESPRRYVVVTVRNPILPVAGQAASTPRGYDNVGVYAVGSRARQQSRDLARQYGLIEVASWPIAVLEVHCLVYALPSGADPGEMIATLGKDSRIESAQPLLAFATASTRYNDPYANLQPNMQRMQIVESHALSRGAGVRIAVVDTGVDTEHPDLRAGAAASRNFVDTDARAFHGDAHGTAVAGIIGAVPNNGVGIVGVAPDVELLAYKACWRASSADTQAACNTFTLAQAIASAIDAHADILNLSLAGPSDPLLGRLVRRAIERGVIVVGAVEPSGTGESFPTDIPGVIAVDAVENGRRATGVINAPGRDVLSLSPAGHYDFYSGSSLATAEISGLVALLRSASPRITSVQARDLLERSAAPAAGVADAAGVPNACRALQMLMHKGSCSREP